MTTFSLSRIPKLNKEQLATIGLFSIFFITLIVVGNLIPQDTIRRFIESAGAFAPAVWIIVIVIIYVLAPLSGSPLILVGFYAFGRQVILYTVISGAIGSAINFYIARKWGRRLVEKLVGKKSMQKIDSYAEHNGAKMLFAIRIFLPNVHEYVSYAAGLTTMSFKTYYTVTLLAFIPITLLWYTVTLFTNDPLLFLGISAVLSFTLFGSFMLWLYLRKRMKRETSAQ